MGMGMGMGDHIEVAAIAAFEAVGSTYCRKLSSTRGAVQRGQIGMFGVRWKPSPVSVWQVR